MKLILMMTVLLLTLSCNEAEKKAEVKSPAPVANTEEQGMTGGIAEENDMCICTKDYRPVCGSNGVTYPNSCQAGCEKITKFTDGPCGE